MDYIKDLYIDDSALDVEVAGQSELMMKYCTISAEAQQVVDLAKEKLTLITSELDQAIRSDPQKFHIEKITDKVVENTIPLQESYKTASREYIDAKFELNVAKGAVDSCEQRKGSLEQLIKLFIANYFAGPKVPRNLTQERQARMQKQEDSKITRERK